MSAAIKQTGSPTESKDANPLQAAFYSQLQAQLQKPNQQCQNPIPTQPPNPPPPQLDESQNPQNAQQQIAYFNQQQQQQNGNETRRGMPPWLAKVDGECPHGRSGCKFYKQGECRYSKHSYDGLRREKGGGKTGNGKSGKDQGKEAGPPEFCRAAKTNNCKYGENCRHLHQAADGSFYVPQQKKQNINVNQNCNANVPNVNTVPIQP